MLLVGFTIEIYYDARPYERQISSSDLYSCCASVGKYFVHSIMDGYEMKWVVMFLKTQLILLSSTVRIWVSRKLFFDRATWYTHIVTGGSK